MYMTHHLGKKSGSGRSILIGDDTAHLLLIEKKADSVGQMEGSIVIL